jgi:hypothetical protein
MAQSPNQSRQPSADVVAGGIAVASSTNIQPAPAQAPLPPDEQTIRQEIEARFPSPRPFTSVSNAPATTQSQQRRYFDQRINAPIQTVVRVGRTSEDNHHSHFSSASRLRRYAANLEQYNNYIASLEAERQAVDIELEFHRRERTSVSSQMESIRQEMSKGNFRPEADQPRLEALNRRLLEHGYYIEQLTPRFDSLTAIINNSRPPSASPTVEDAYINAGSLGRAAGVANMGNYGIPTNAFFMPSAIPVAGQPFYHSPSNAALYGQGSILSLDAGTPTTQTSKAAGRAITESCGWEEVEEGGVLGLKWFC